MSDCCPNAATAFHGTVHPFSITKRSRQGVARFEAAWFPTGHTASFPTKREAVAFIKAHEAKAYGR